MHRRRGRAHPERLSRTPIKSSEQFAQRELYSWHAAAGENGVFFDHRALRVGAADGLAIDFDLPCAREDDPVFLHTRLGVERGEGAVFRGAGDGDFDDEGRRVGVALREVTPFASDKRKIGLGLGVEEG